MATNITITSDDLNKSEVLGDFIAKALENGGFTQVQPTFTVGFMQTDPILEKMGLLEHDDKSALQIIQNAYPNFLAEPINVRAIKVENLDVNGYEEEDEDLAHEKRESAVRTKSGNELMTSIFIYEDRPGKKPRHIVEEEKKGRDEKLRLIINEIQEELKE